MEHILVISPKFNHNSYEFIFERINIEVYDEFLEIMEYIDTESHIYGINRLEKIVLKYPEFIEAWVSLGLAYKSINETLKCFMCLNAAVNIGKSSLPRRFNFKKHTIEWIFSDNRPFLRALHSLGLIYQDLRYYANALEIYEYIFNINPNDNQGIRELIIECYLGTYEYSKLLDFYNSIDDYALTGMTISYVLALIAIGKFDQAKDIITCSWKAYKLIWLEILKKTHRISFYKQNFGVSSCGKDMAQYYWSRCGKYWEEVEGAIDFLKEISTTLLKK